MFMFYRESSEKNAWVDFTKVWSSSNVFVSPAGIDKYLLMPDRPSSVLEVRHYLHVYMYII